MILVIFFEPPFTREFDYFFRKVVNCELIKLMIYYDIYSSICIILNNIYWTLLQIRKILYTIDIHTNNKNNNLENQIYFAEYWKIAFRVSKCLWKYIEKNGDLSIVKKCTNDYNDYRQTNNSSARIRLRFM